jgi:hypothetical protein
MTRRGVRNRKRLLAFGAVVGLAPAIALLSLGSLGSEIATAIQAYTGCMGIVLAWLALSLQRQADTKPAGEDPAPRGRAIAGSTRPRLAMSSRPVIIVLAVVILLSGVLAGISPSPPGSKTLLAVGGLVLLQEDSWLHNQRVLVFQLPDGQYGYLARPDARWWQPWPTIDVAPAWPGFTHATVFASDYSGLEFLGLQDGSVMFAYRDNVHHWHDPVPIQINRLPLTGVSASPGFMQYGSLASGNLQFMALIPRPQGGLGLYVRIEHPPWNWRGQVGVIGATVRGISAVTAAELGDGSLCVIVRAGPHLFEMTHPASGLPSGAGSGWSAPVEVRSNRGPITASGNPQLIAATVSAAGATEILMAVPVPGGAELLSTAEPSTTWHVEQLPIHQEVDALTLLPDNVNGRANIDVIYRQGNHLFSTWRWDNGPWRGPSSVSWGK